MLKHYSVDGLDKHIAEHKALLNQVVEYRVRIATDDGVTMEKCLNF